MDSQSRVSWRVAGLLQPALGMSFRVADVVREGLASLGHPHAALFESVGLDPNWKDDPDRRITHAQGIGLLRGAVDVSAEERFGLYAAKAYRPGATGFEYLVRHSATLGSLAERTCRYFQLTVEAAAPVLEVDGEAARWCFRLRGGIPMPVVLGDMIVAVAAMFGRAALGAMPRIEVAHPRPRDIRAYRDLLGVEVTFSARDYQLCFPRQALALPLRGADENLSRVLEAHLREQLERAPRLDSATALVRAELMRALPDGQLDLDRIADRLALGGRTLRRRLAGEGASYREILDDLRKDLACKQLADPSLSVEEVAFLLGFSETSAFHRAFRRWSGESPSSYRRRALRTHR